MEGNRFIDPGTPPIQPEYPSDASNTTINSISTATLKEPAFDEKMEASTSENNGTLLRRMSRQDHAFRLVDSVTHQDARRRPSRAGILSNLLKLDTFENHRQNKARPPRTNNNTQSTPPTRPTYQLKSLASSRALLRNFGGTQSARSSLYLDDLQRAELGINKDVEVAAHRMAIASEIADILQRQDIIVKIGKMLVRTGAPSHRIVSFFPFHLHFLF
jgi:hypothetical protein